MPDEKKREGEKNPVIELVTQQMKEEGIEIDPAIAPDENTLSHLDTYISKQGVQSVRVSLPNVRKILTLDPRWAGSIRYNLLACSVEIDGKSVRDVDESEIVCQLGNIYAFKVSENMVSSAMRLVAEGNQYHPVREYLDGVTWDKKPRIDGLLSSYFGAEDTEINKIMGRRFMISAVARAYQMGCQVDTVLVLTGKQGAKKSTGFRALAGGDRFFSDTQLDLNSKDSLMQLKGVWLYEISEMDSMRRSEQTRIKAFISSRVDRYRPSYGRNVEEQPRGCVFVGTTNDQIFLSDATGSRRFLPAKIGAVNLPAIIADRDQLWAEATTYYKAGEPWYLSTNEEQKREAAAEDYELIHPWTEPIQNYLALNFGPVTTGQIMNQALDIDVDKRAAFHTKKITEIMRRLGRESRRVRIDGKRFWAWVKPDDDT